MSARVGKRREFFGFYGSGDPPLSFHLLHQFEVFAHGRPNSFRTKTPFAFWDRLPSAKIGGNGPAEIRLLFRRPDPIRAGLFRLACSGRIDVAPRAREGRFRRGRMKTHRSRLDRAGL